MNAPAPLRFGRWIEGTVVALIAIFLLAPAAIVVPMSFAGDAMTRFPPRQFSFETYVSFLNSQGWVASTLLSVKMAATVMIVAVGIGAAAAYGLIAATASVRKLLMVLVLMPIVVPPIIYAISVYGLLASWGLLGTFLGLVVANVVLALPYAVITIRAGMERLDWSLMRAAAVLGAGPVRVTVKIAAPLLLPSLMSAALFTFLAAFDEVIVAQFISGPLVVPLTKRMWDGILYRWDPAISAISTIQIGLTVAALLIFALLQRRSAPSAETSTQTARPK